MVVSNQSGSGSPCSAQARGTAACSAGTSCLEGLATNATSCPVASTSRASRSSRALRTSRRLDPPAQLSCRSHRTAQAGERRRAATAAHDGQPRLPGHGPNLRPTRADPPRPAQPRPARRDRQRQLTRRRDLPLSAGGLRAGASSVQRVVGFSGDRSAAPAGGSRPCPRQPDGSRGRPSPGRPGARRRRAPTLCVTEFETLRAEQKTLGKQVAKAQGDENTRR